LTFLQKFRTIATDSRIFILSMLEAKTREIRGRKTYELRGQRLVPAVVYGAGIDPKMLTIDRNEFVRLYQEEGESSLFDLVIDGKETLKVIIQDYQLDPLLNEVIHADFRVIDLTKPMEVDIELEFIGESPAVKALGGTLIKTRDFITIRCLPDRLPEKVEIDLSKLETLTDSVHVRDLHLPEGVEILDEADRTLVVISAPRSEEEMKALDEVATEIIPAEEKKESTEEKEGQA